MRKRVLEVRRYYDNIWWVSGLVAVVRRERLAAGREVRRAGRGALRARQRGGRGRRLAGHVARFPHGRPYNTPNTELFTPVSRRYVPDNLVTKRQVPRLKELNVWWMLSTSPRLPPSDGEAKRNCNSIINKYEIDGMTTYRRNKVVTVMALYYCNFISAWAPYVTTRCT